VLKDKRIGNGEKFTRVLTLVVELYTYEITLYFRFMLFVFLELNYFRIDLASHISVAL